MKAKYILLAAAFVFAAACEKPMTDISEDSVSLDLSDIEKYMPYSGNHDGSDEFGRYWTRSMYSEEGAEGRLILRTGPLSSYFYVRPFPGFGFPYFQRSVPCFFLYCLAMMNFC